MGGRVVTRREACDLVGGDCVMVSALRKDEMRENLFFLIILGASVVDFLPLLTKFLPDQDFEWA